MRGEQSDRSTEQQQAERRRRRKAMGAQLIPGATHLRSSTVESLSTNFCRFSIFLLAAASVLTRAQTVIGGTTLVSNWENTPVDDYSLSHWTQWGQWSSCLGSPCEQSVRNRKRLCHSETSEEGAMCEGASIAYELCLFNKRCLRSRIAEQCRDHNTETIRYYPATSDEYSHCGQLECHEEHRGGNSTEPGTFIRMLEMVVDGVQCAPDRQCLNGQCKSANCSFNRSEILHGCLGSNNSNLCTVLCGQTQPTTEPGQIALSIPQCASNIIIHVAKQAIGNLLVWTRDNHTVELDFSGDRQVTHTLAGMPIVFSKSQRSISSAFSIGEAYFDQISIQGPLTENLTVYDEFGELGLLQYHYTLGDACGVKPPPRIEEGIPEEEKNFTAALVFQPLFNPPTERAPPDEQVQQLQAANQNSLDPNDAPFVTQNGGLDQQLSWILLPFTHCSRSCGGGTKRASVICGSRQMRVFPASYCSNSARKPSDIVEPCNQHRCPARWVTGGWTCSSSCRRNGTGFRTRTVACRQVLENGVDSVVSQKFCTQVEPNSIRPCRPDLCRTQWVKGRWSKCDATCGPGTKTRSVYCAVGSQRVNSSFCARLRRPNLMKNCSRRDCVQWQGGEWSECNSQCASGYRFRELVCMEVPHRGRAPRVKDDSQCSHLAPLKKMERCGNDHATCPIQYKWHTGQWSKCSSKCGRRGQRMREVHCSTDRRTNSTLGVVKYTTVDPIYCNNSRDLGPPPASMEPCNRHIQCEGVWVKGRWSPCSVTCGFGKLTRSVTCQKREPGTEQMRVTSESDCDTSKRKPRTMNTCSPGACEQTPSTGELCTGDDKNFKSACLWAHERHVCHISYFRQYCCATCSSVA
eukprot:scpid14688/ scgid32200/ Thrombospondin type-1 domain-containing protein 4; A disintegrin and metalloproteinase with thrombospondin motifs-like protein 6